ncbi:pilus assembly protein PilX [Diaphorobacter ruginosibacter]|uniref:pilus assembly PilX family protein n=1 Tax=Diaphorobacter ruginosibacter TaxID=1715720 RepID=UPI00333F6911
MRSITHSHVYAREKGASLYIVMIVVLMAILMAIWTVRTALFNEMLTSNDADYQRTFEAAQSMLEDAELDIRGIDPSGRQCGQQDYPDRVCRTHMAVHFDFDPSELSDILAYLDEFPTGCQFGICRKRNGAQDFWNDPQYLMQMTAPDVGARYGQFTGAHAGLAGNPILAERASAKNAAGLQGAWYWIEILPYASANLSLLSRFEGNTQMAVYAPDPQRPWIYRITALARGRQKGSEVVVQSILTLRSLE